MRIFRRRIETRPCRCGHSDLLHMGLYGKCLASLDGTGSNDPRRFSDLCCEVDGGCRSFTALAGEVTPAP